MGNEWEIHEMLLGYSWDWRMGLKKWQVQLEVL